MLYAAVEAAAPSATFTGIPVHPGLDASAKEEDDWWRAFDNVLKGTDAAHWVVSRDPPRLASLEPADLSGFTEVAVPASSDAGYFPASQHNMKVRAAVQENERRRKVREDYRWQSASTLPINVLTLLPNITPLTIAVLRLLTQPMIEGAIKVI